jgi:hypothetical integral membrane protein (TIGR02206 family)
MAAIAVAMLRPPPARALAVAMAGAFVAEQIAYVVTGEWRATLNLPLQLSDAVTFVAIAALWRPRPRLAELLWFWALTASLQAVLTPDLGADFPELLYWTFFITHAGAVVAAVLLVVGRRITPREGAVGRAFGATLVVAAAAAVANVVTGGNYMWLREKPDSASLLDVMGPWPWYIVTAAVLALVLFTLLDLPFRSTAAAR